MGTVTVPEILLSVPERREVRTVFNNSSMSTHNWKRRMYSEVMGGARIK